MIRVENFLGCFKLETGGLIVGWFSLVSDVVAIVGCLFSIILLSIYSCQDLKKMVENSGETMVDSQQFDEFCNFGKGVVIVVMVIIALISLGFAAIAFLCIKGTENRDHVRVKPMMVLLAIAAIISFLNILTFSTYGVVSGLIYGALYSYLFIVLYSLFSTFRDEYERGMTAQYHQPTAKV